MFCGRGNSVVADVMKRANVGKSFEGGELNSDTTSRDQEQLVRVIFALEADMPYETESIWAKAAGNDLFVLDNVPFFAFGVSCGDKVAARIIDDRLRFSGVVEPSGHSTYRVYLNGGVSQAASADFARELQDLGCHREIGTQKFWAFDLPPKTDIFKVYAVLERGQAEGIWTFEEGHVGHPVS